MIIKWKVENESDIKNYGVEYSTDGIHFTQIGVVSASESFHGNYKFTHFHPNAGNAFYRIKINKINGESAYQKVLKVIIPADISGIKIYPNPVRGNDINLQFKKQPFGKYRFSLYNSLGQKVFAKEIIYKGETNLSLKCWKSINTGVYQLEIIKPNGEKYSIKIKSY